MKPPEISAEIVSLIGAVPESIQFLRYSQNFVFEFTRVDGTRQILRLTPDSHRLLPEIEDELNWVLYLRGSGLSVCPPLKLQDGFYARSLQGAAEVLHAVVFEKAQGQPLTKQDLSPELYRLHGEFLGSLHELSKKAPRDLLGRRKKWHEERYFTSDIGNYLPGEVQEPVRDAWRKMLSRLDGEDASHEHFGPVHLDAGYSNFFLNRKRLEFFDFDNCANGFYACDIAAALYSGIFNVLRCEFPGDRSAFEHPKTTLNLEQILGPFREGYQSTGVWQREWDGQMATWFQVIYLRSVVHAFRLQHPVTNPKVKALLDVDIQNVLRGEMPLRFNFCAGNAVA